MNKLRKIVGWLWRNKERMVLIIMVGFLSWRVYEVVSPPAPEEGVMIIPPRASGPLEVPSPGPLPLGGDEGTSPRRLVERNPWTLFPPEGYSRAAESTPQNPGVYLEQIIPWPDGTYKAKLRTASTVYYAAEGDEFEDFTVMEIGAAEGTCVVLDSKSGKMIPLQASR